MILLFVAPAGLSPALTVTNYSSAANDRFSSGYPSAPVENTDPAFVGLGLDWAGVGWASTVATKSFGFLSPRHYLVARHFGGAANIRIFADGTLQTYAQQSVEDIDLGVVFEGQTLGDISLGTLTTAVPASGGLPRYAVLDLNNASGTNTPSDYNNLPVLLYGRGPDSNASTRVGATSISSVTVSGNNHSFTTSRTQVQLESGDSGSPAIHHWTNPAGGEELTLVGNHAAINDTSNFINFLGTFQVMNELNARMKNEGFALRVVGNPSNTWVGSSSASIGNAGAWGLGGPGPPVSAPSDRFVNFDGNSAGNNRLVTVDSDHNSRGLYFLPTGTDNKGFSFDDGSTLTLGRGGITNYDGSRQVFNAALALDAPQFWDGGAGGITAGNINTAGHLLEITGSGLNRITGSITGSGSLALFGGELELSGSNSYSGATWVHSGTLRINNLSGSGAGSGPLGVAAEGTLAGSGFLANVTTVSGRIAPGNSLGTLTIANDVIWNAGVSWLFELGTAAASLADAALGLSSQDMLTVTGSGSDFLRGSGSGWTFDTAGTGGNGWYRLVQWEGATTFNADDFAVANLAAGKTGAFVMDDSTSALYLNVIPEPGALWLVGIGVLASCLTRRRAF